MRSPVTPSTPLLLALSVAISGCAWGARPRAVAAGERIRLGTVEVQVPEEPGWEALDVDRRHRRDLELTHRLASGEIDLFATVTEQRLPSGRWTLEGALEQVLAPSRLRLDAAEGGHPAPGLATEGDPAPAVARARFTMPAPDEASGAEWIDLLAFVPPDRLPPRLVRAELHSTSGTSALEGAVPVLDGLRLRPRGSPSTQSAPGSAPDLTVSEWVVAGLGPSTVVVDGRATLGAELRLGAIDEAFVGGTAVPRALGLELRYFLGGGRDLLANSALLGVSLQGVHGRLRGGLNADLGVLWTRREGESTREALTAGGRAFVGIDLLRGASHAVALEAEAAALAHHWLQTTVRLVLRRDISDREPARGFPVAIPIPHI